MEFGTLMTILFTSMLVNNLVLAQFLGICPFLGVSTRIKTAFSMGLAVTFVMLMAGVITWLIQNFLLIPRGLGYLQTVAFILVVASFVQLVEMFLMKFSPTLYRTLGVYVALITTNCAIMGMALIIALREYAFTEGIFYALGSAVGFTLAIVAFASMRERMEKADIAPALKGAPIALVAAALMSIAFMGFSGFNLAALFGAG